MQLVKLSVSARCPPFLDPLGYGALDLPHRHVLDLYGLESESEEGGNADPDDDPPREGVDFDERNTRA